MKKAKKTAKTKKHTLGFPVVTTESVPGHATGEYVGFVWGTTVRAKFIGHDILAAVKTLMGGEVWQYTEMINNAKQFVINRMVKNAKALGADAVVNARLGSAQIIPGTIEIFAYGTAVTLKKK